MWFENLMGFPEETPDQVRSHIELEGNLLKSLVNGRMYQHGFLEIPQLSNLRSESKTLLKGQGKLRVHELIGDVQHFHQLKENEGGLFQAASQFNLLEMVNPQVTPEIGVGIYEYDNTQGPACAIACGAGTIYRNYFAKVGSSIGQSAENQIDCLDELGRYFDNAQLGLWRMENGYAFAQEQGLKHISQKIQSLGESGYEQLKGLLKVGIQWDTEVTISPQKQTVSQIYCSALPVAYSNTPAALWKEFALLILEATYEATLHAAVLNRNRTSSNKIFLTLVGGGVFGNKSEWIKQAILKSINLFQKEALEVYFVSYGGSNPLVREIIEEY